jgi:FMN-dependent NADH-azoreductase
MNLLHIDSSILGANSVSRKLSADIVARLRSASPDSAVAYRDLGEAAVPHLTGATFLAARSPSDTHEPAVQADLAIGSAVLQEFLEADTVVIGVAFYNFSIPSQLKAWIDRILVAGQTFRYGPDGRPEGLADGKRVILAIARGGYYGPGAPTEAYEHAERYLRTALGFIGITEPEVVIAEGLMAGPERRLAALAEAGQRIASIAA